MAIKINKIKKIELLAVRLIKNKKNKKFNFAFTYSFFALPFFT